MLFTFEEYTNEPRALSFEEMQTLHGEIISEIGNDADAQEIYTELAAKATAYAKMRADWFLMDQKDRMEKDSLRTSRHNSLITHFNMLARYLKIQGKKADWRDALGYEEDNPYNRKRIGDFGCYIVFVNSVHARWEESE